MAQILRHKYVADEYRPDLLTEVTQYLANPKQALVILSSKSLPEESLTIPEKWYKQNYSLEKIPEARINELNAASAPDNGKALDLPPVNNLIATNFDILPEDRYGEYLRGNTEIGDASTVRAKTPLYETSHRPATKT